MYFNFSVINTHISMKRLLIKWINKMENICNAHKRISIRTHSVTIVFMLIKIFQTIRIVLGDWINYIYNWHRTDHNSQINQFRRAVLSHEAHFFVLLLFSWFDKSQKGAFIHVNEIRLEMTQLKRSFFLSLPLTHLLSRTVDCPAQLPYEKLAYPKTYCRHFESN